MLEFAGISLFSFILALKSNIRMVTDDQSDCLLFKIEKNAHNTIPKKVQIDENIKTSHDEQDDDDDDEEDLEDEARIGDSNHGEGGDKKKKKKKKKKPKKKQANQLVPSKLPHSRLLGGFTDYYIKYGQTDPPTRYYAIVKLLYSPIDW